MTSIAYATTPPSSPGKVPPEARYRYDQQFEMESAGKPFITAMKASLIFMDSGLSRDDLETIWDRTDWNSDGKLDREEFIHGMYMIECRLRNKYQQHSYAPPSGPPPSGPPQSSNMQHLSSSYTQAPQQPPRPSQWQGPPSPQPSHSSAVPPPSSLPPYSNQQLPGQQMGQQQQQQQQPRTLNQPKALKCRGCAMGLVPGATIHHCFQCGDSHTWCTGCYRPGGAANGGGGGCTHSLPAISFQRGPDWPTKAPGSLGSYCSKCFSTLKGEALVYCCDRCDQPNLCEKCWRKGKSCRHFPDGSVALRVIKKKKGGKGDLVEGLAEGAMAILGG